MARTKAQAKADKKYEKKRAERSKVWAGIVYPDSAPDDWIDRLKEQMVDAYVSPLHDKDCNPDGEIKKAHWHVLLMFGSLKTKQQASETMLAFGCMVEPARVSNTRGYARYLCHLDNPEKHQYSTDDVIGIGGVDYLSTIGLPTDKYTMLAEIIDWCEENQVYGYYTLVRYARNNRWDWFRYLSEKGHTVREMLQSATWEKSQGLGECGKKGENRDKK